MGSLGDGVEGLDLGKPQRGDPHGALSLVRVLEDRQLSGGQKRPKTCAPYPRQGKSSSKRINKKSNRAVS